MLRRHGHEVGFAAFYGLAGAPLTWDGFPVFPATGEDPFARDVLPIWYAYFKADLCITLIDVFALDPSQLQGMNLAHWIPVDAEPMSVIDAQVLRNSPGRPVAMTRFGQRVLSDAGLDPLYAPHALDMNVWQPLEVRAEARTQLGWDDKFIIGVNAANQDPVRKGLAEQLKAFKRFLARHPDARMVIHSRARTQNGIPLDALIEQEGLGGKAGLGDQAAIAGGLVGEGAMVTWHSVVDVLSNCSYGEGFGLATLQSQACGIPVVVTDTGASAELCGAGWKVETQEWWNKNHQANWNVPLIKAIDAAYEKAYTRAGDPRLKAKAVRFARQYDSERVYTDHWAEVLEQLTPPRLRPVTAAPPRIFDTFMYRNESAMLKLRLEETAGMVDMHVLAEAETTHRMVPKPLHYASAGKSLARYASRIVPVVAELPGAEDPWVNEHAQRDAAWAQVDKVASDRDWVLICDVDEIPSPSLLARLRSGQMPGDEVAAVRMKVFIHHARFRVPDEYVPPQCVVATAGYIRRHGGSLAAVRDGRASYPVIEDGGWHFSWFGGPDAAREKLETATCHTELLTNGEGDLIADGTRYYTTETGGGLPVIPVEIGEDLPAAFRDGKVPAVWLGPEVTVPA